MLRETTRTIAAEFADLLVRHGYGPFLGTPCGVLAPLYESLDLITVPREDNAVGMAAGAALGGANPVVLMQNSGLGQSVNALASLVVPYRIPMLLVVGMRGLPPDTTSENLAMGRLTVPILTELGIGTENFGADVDLAGLMARLVAARICTAVLVRPDAFGWRA